MLKINNISGFRNQAQFNLQNGLNLVIGDNTAGKTSFINSIKVLNKLPVPEGVENPSKVYHRYLNDKTDNGSVFLKNTDYSFYNKIVNPVKKITDFMKTNNTEDKKPLEKPIQRISEDPRIVPFTFIDTENRIMEEIEYSGNIELLKQKIMEISNVTDYEEILSEAKKLYQKYKKEKEEHLSKLNDKRKSLNIDIDRKRSHLKQKEADLAKISVSEEATEEYKKAVAEKDVLTKQFDEISYKKLGPLKEEVMKNSAKIEKNKNEYEKQTAQKTELVKYKNLKDRILKHQEKIAEIDRKIAEIDGNKKELNSKRSILHEKLGLLDDTLDMGEPICPHCLGEIDPDKIIEEREKIAARKEEHNKKINSLTKRKQQLEADRAKINNMLIQDRLIPQKVSKLTEKIANLEKKISDLKRKIEDGMKQVNVLEKQLEDISAQKQRVMQKIIALGNNTQEEKDKQTKLLSECNLLKDQIAELNDKISEIQKRILILPEKYNQIISRVERFSKIVNNLLDEFYFDFLDFANTQLEKLLDQLNWDFERVFVDDNLDIKIINSDGESQDFANLSNFERKSIGILIILIFKLKYFPDYPVFAIDEHLNSADPRRFIKFIKFIDTLIEKDDSLFLVTILPFEENISALDELEAHEYGELIIYN